jgi:hypothetical protein
MVVMLDRRSSSNTQSICVKGELGHPELLSVPIGAGSYFLWCDCGWAGYVQIDSAGGIAENPILDDIHRCLFERGHFSDQIIESIN